MPNGITTRDVIAFRLHAHHLAERLDDDGLTEAARLCGIQNSPPGSALLALHARVRNVTPERVQQAIADHKSLLQTWCMRGAPFVVPTADAAVFTTGVLPPSEEAMRHFLPGVAPALQLLGMSLTEAIARTRDEIGDVLAGRRLPIGPLGTAIAQRVAAGLTPAQRAVWQDEGPYAQGQPLGEGVVHFCLRILALRRVVCFAPRTGNRAPFVLVDEWLDHPLPDVDPARARAELLRRYLRCYGPSTRGDFAAWVGVSAGDAAAWWDLLSDELTRVAFGGGSWILTEDLDALRSSSMPTGVRLLPPHDPYTQTRDRDTLVPPTHRRQVWRTVGDPGAVLVRGQITGTWRARIRGRTLAVTITTFSPLPQRDRQALQREAERVAPLRGAASVDVAFSA